MHARIDAGLLTKVVDERTVTQAFLHEGRTNMQKLIEKSHREARISPHHPSQSVDSLLTYYMRAAIPLPLSTRIEGQNLVLILLDILTPIGGLVPMALTIFSSPLSSEQVMIVFSLASACQGFGAYAWMCLAHMVAIPHLACCAGLMQMTLLPLLFAPSHMGAGATFALVAVQSFASGASVPIFQGLNYLNKWSGDTRVMGVRMGMVEPLRVGLQMMLCGLLSSHEDSYVPTAASQLVFGIVTALLFVLSLLCLWLPIDHQVRVPRVEVSVKTLLRFPSFCCITLAEVVYGLVGFADVLFLDWMLIVSLDRSLIALFFYVSGVAAALGALAFCWALTGPCSLSRPLVVGVALFIFSPTVLGALTALSSPQLGSSLACIVLGLAMLFGVVKRLGLSLLTVFSLPSRWKFITFSSRSALVQKLISAGSPVLLLWLSHLLDVDLTLSHESTYSDVFARSLLTVSLPFAAAQFVLHCLALQPLLREGLIKWWPNPWHIASESGQVPKVQQGEQDLMSDAVEAAMQEVNQEILATELETLHVTLQTYNEEHKALQENHGNHLTDSASPSVNQLNAVSTDKDTPLTI